MPENTPNTPAPVTPAPGVVEPTSPDRLSVPVSALDLGFDTRTELHKLAGVTGPAEAAPAPTGPAAPAATGPAPASTGATGPAPAATAPTGPAPAVTGATGPAATGPTPPKVKIGNKEYTVEELEKEMVRLKQAQQQPPAAPTGPAAPQLTPEQIAQKKAQIKAEETAWRDGIAKSAELNYAITEDEMETLLSGGKPAIELLAKKLKDLCTESVLLARKTIYDELNPELAKYDAAIAPLLSQSVSLERQAIEASFAQQFPEFGAHASLVREMGEAMYQQYPQLVTAMTPQQFIEELARQSDREIQARYLAFNPGATDNWRDKAKAALTQAAPAPVTTAPVVTPPAAPAPAASAPPVQQPMHANSPAGTPAASQPNFHKETAKSLAD